ncbi:putative tetratricopeptide-like helical domain superfamily, pentacotripeptide-repeat region of PRORP [Helianthus annuus]|uniref:Tetratricopeptide-like helical domain superfamily, pentacotripeptide-repeat region of PRORP n=1 Tax=Helianthus annuus TaxID=4232 RepID=A0A9K3NQ63_HELAN|nr:pentatricopeptide repeat-containing protein At4g04790, mitochondrial [Helianthus annuus]KAF5807413.1 putative tetratricopeptide-like helical domain superfamily, pentacotripeptide-repeat region of PRORP [Helianthus annuus]KAJ0571492.1 putative tetratricopeptide-like helical domain superfamily, pentacotripeptide-repeat region of PRORP [Helianthus annuus]KAJ0585898.1 putative tetratricopeptide-like helical domain superfamily, pentacotripeptide-repeat region of PRORP [Helianthus annuus]KAJ092054
MSGKARNITRLVNSATTFTYSDRTAKTLARTAATTTSAANDVTLANYIRFTPDSSSSLSKTSVKPLSELTVESIRVNASSIDDSKSELKGQLKNILCGVDVIPESEEDDYQQPLVSLLELRWHQPLSNSVAHLNRKEVSRDRKQLWVFKSTQSNRFGRLVKMCAEKLGANATLEVFRKLDRETGVKEFNFMIEHCIEKARNAVDEDAALEEFHRAYVLFEIMRERGFTIGEETYGPFLLFVIDMGMVEEFHFYCDHIKKDNPKSLQRLAYYEMLLWIKVGDEDKIQKLIGDTLDTDDSNFNENYLLALCEADRQEEVSILLDSINIKKVSSKENMEMIFKSLGKLLLESHAKKFIVELKTEGKGGNDLSNLIYCYAMSMPKIHVEDIVEKFKSLHAELKVATSSGSHGNLIKACCDSHEVHLAIDLVDSMLEDGLEVKTMTVNYILTACFASFEYTLVHRINSIINDHESIKPNAETFRLMISMYVKLNDFDRAYGMIKDLEKLKLLPTANMYNAIMGGYFRQKNFHKGMMVLKQMDATNVKPDSQTFSYIIGNCNSEDDIIKYRRELHEAGVQPTKHIFMALINAYAACGLFEKAKQVLSDKVIHSVNMNEVKSVLVSALATNGQLADALDVYDEIKQTDANLEPKAIISLIEHLQSEGELSRLLLLLNQLHDPELWDDGCARVISYCVRYKLSDSAVELLKQRMEKSNTNEMVIDVLFDEVFCQIAETEPPDVQFGLDLLQALKNDIGIRPSRKSLDFLLSACVNAKDQERSFLVWNEYQTAGLPYNVLSYVRMYQALLASGAHKRAKVLLENIPDDDPDVRGVLKACQETFGKTAPVRNKGKKKKKNRVPEECVETLGEIVSVKSEGKKKKKKKPK